MLAYIFYCFDKFGLYFIFVVLMYYFEDLLTYSTDVLLTKTCSYSTDVLLIIFLIVQIYYSTYVLFRFFLAVWLWVTSWRKIFLGTNLQMDLHCLQTDLFLN